MRILLVDDEVDLVDSLSRLLTREGYTVDTAYNGQAAVALLKLQEDPSSHRYDLLVLDWMVPQGSGLWICQAMRAQGDPTPILFLTAKDTVDDRVEGLDAGADDYLVKPFELRELLARVRALLRRPVNLSPAELPAVIDRLRCQDLELDPNNQVVYWQGQSLSLSEKETQLLALFMQNPGHLLSHDQIDQHLWPTGQKPSSNVLAAQVRLLRRKIEGLGMNQDPSCSIQSVYGKGYRFGASPE